MRRVTVLPVNGDGNGKLHCKKSWAFMLVRNGVAEWSGDWQIKMKPAISSPLKCGQEASYESLGAERFPVIFNGGLTRTETKPRKIPKFQAARIGHQ